MPAHSINESAMSVYSDCSTGVLPASPVDNCDVKFGQASRGIIQKINSAPGVKNSISTTGDAHLLLATYQALIAASDDTKAFVTPRFSNPTMPNAEGRTAGSGNQVPNGSPVRLDTPPADFNVEFLNKPQEIIDSVDQLNGELGIILFDHLGRIGALVDDMASPTAIFPIPFFNKYVSDLMLGGLEENDKNMMAITFFAGWSKKFKIFEPSDFNPLIDL